VRLIRVLAPLTPFVTEVMYQNLVRAVQPAAYESVHQTLWPQAETATVDETLVAQMALAREAASLGLSARNSANVKIRQPLGRALVYAGPQGGGLSEELASLVRDELNVKELVFVEDESLLVTYRLAGEGRLLGPKYGALYPRIRQALAAVDASQAVRRLRAGQPLEVPLGDETVTLLPEEVIVNSEPAAGLAVASEKGVTLAVDTTITPSLRAEGLVRDLVRYVQTLRKDADFALDDRITVGLLDLNDEARAAVAEFEGYFRQETLASTVLFADDGGTWNAGDSQKLDGQPVEVRVRR
jgi:isoleucyl-tRNA synthetase